MEMPLRAFWSANANAGRLEAEQSFRLLQALAAAQSSDGYQDMSESLKEEIGNPTVSIDNRRDTDATKKLREALTGL